MSLKGDQVDLRDVYITILAGGSGTRLWPLSRNKSPKQLLPLLGGCSTLRQAVDRVLPLVPAERIYILTGPEHASSIAQQLPELPGENIWIEPSPRGTGPCLGLAAMRLRRATSGEGIMISLHSDHAVVQEERFRDALRAAVLTARMGQIVTIGIVPAHPETGFGYIERGELLSRQVGQDVFRIARFTEKPPLERAREFVASGRYYWNAGYFAWQLDRIIGEFRRLLPEVYAQLDAVVLAMDSAQAGDAIDRAWNQIKPVTIDVGIIERARDLAVIPADLGWNDIGSWAALFEILPHDDQGNVLLGQGKHVAIDTHDSLVHSRQQLVVTLGLADVIVVATDDAVLVLPKSRAQEVSALVKELKARGLGQYL